METKEITPAQLQGSLVETITEFKEYEVTDRQDSNTASVQCEAVAGLTSFF